MSAGENGHRPMPSITPEQDEVASYRRSGRAEAPVQSSLKGLLGFALALMMLGLAVGGYTLYQVQQKLEHANNLLSQGQRNISDLEARLASTGTDVSKTLRDVKSQVDTNFLEIDKLWALAHRKNKPDIQKNVRAIEKLEIDMNGRLDTAIAATQAMNSQTQKSLAALQELRASLVADSEEMTIQMSLLGQRLQVVDANRKEVARLNQRMKEVQEAITAIDKHRQQINQRLIALQKMRAETPPPAANSP